MIEVLIKKLLKKFNQNKKAKGNKQYLRQPKLKLSKIK